MGTTYLRIAERAKVNDDKNFPSRYPEEDSAIRYYRKSYGAASVHKDSLAMYSVNLKLSDIFREINKSDSSYYYAEKCELFYRSILNKSEKNSTIDSPEKNNLLDGLGMALTNKGRALELKKQYDDAMKNHQATLKIYNELLDNEGIIVSTINIAHIHEQKKMYDSAIYYYQQAKIMEEKKWSS